MPRRLLPWILAAVVPAVMLHLALTRGGFGISPDSVFYLAAARTIVLEGRIATPIAYDDVAVPIGTGPRAPRLTSRGRGGVDVLPMTRWPPGYPLSIAAVMQLTGTSAVNAARIGIVATSLASLLLFAALAARMVGTRRGLLCAAALGVLPFFQMSTQWAWSESLFMALTLGALYLLTRWTAAPHRVLPLVGAAVLAALTVWTRYLGIALFPVLLGAAAWTAWRRPNARNPRMGTVALALLPYPVLLTPLLTRNWRLSGTLTGGVTIGTWSRSLLRPIQPVLSLVESFLPTQHALPGPSDFLTTLGFSVAVWAMAGAILFTTGRHLRGGPAADVGQRAPGIQPSTLAALYAGTYLLAVVVLAGTTVISTSPRMVYPAAVAVALPFSLAFARRVPEGAALAVTGVMVVVFGLATFASVRFTERLASGWPGYNTPRLLERPLLAWARANRASLPSLIFAEPWFIGAAQVDGAVAARRLPDLDELASELSRGEGESRVYLVSTDMAVSWPCAAYLDRYQAVLGAVADSVVHGDGWSAWWVRGGRESAEGVLGAVGRGSRHPCTY